MSELIDYFVRSYSLVLDNDQDSYRAVQRAVRDAVLEETPSVTPARYKAVSDETRRGLYAQAIGANVLALIEELTDGVLDAAENDRPTGVALIKEVLITTGGDMAWALGVNYLPEDGDDLDEWMSDEDEDEGPDPDDARDLARSDAEDERGA